jgi:hypothetical protein
MRGDGYEEINIIRCYYGHISFPSVPAADHRREQQAH